MPAVPCRVCRREYPAVEGEPAPGMCPDCREASTVSPTLGAVSSEATVCPTAQPSQPGPTALPSLPSLPGYEVLGELGRGGMGVVYLARQVALNRNVALKVILVGAHAGADERARFRAEAETGARLHHPNIVQVYDLGEWAVPGLGVTTPYLSLEYCGGGSLDGRLRAGPLPPHLAAGLIEALAWAIQHAHDQNVVHRDLKPANILFTEKGVPKITDFGMAKRLGEQGQTKSGTVMGTPSYMAPEQAAGKSKHVGPATDVYALGAILFECLTGRPPFRGQTPLETILAVATDPAPSLPPTAPPALQAICRRCLQKDPRDRYATAAELADDLRRYLGGQRVAAFGMPGAPDAAPGHSGVFARCVAAVVAGAVLVAGAAWMLSRSGEPPPEREPGPRLKNFQPAFRLPDSDHVVMELRDSPAGVARVAFAPGGERLVTGGNDGVVRVWDLTQQEVSRVLKGHEPGGPIAQLSVSADGRLALSVGADGSARVWDLEAGRPLWAAGPQPAVHAAAFTGAAERLQVLTGGPAGAALRDALTGESTGAITLAAAAEGLAIAGRPGARRVLALHRDGTLSLNEIDAGRAPRTIRESSGAAFTCCAIGHDGAQVVTGNGQGEVRLWGADGELEYDFRKLHGGAVVATAASPASPLAVTAGADRKVHVLHLRRQVVVTTHTDAAAAGLAFSPDGRHFATAGPDGTVRLWGVLPPER